MAYVHVYQPDELNPNHIVATKQLQASNALVGNASGLKASYEENGYLLFRNVLECSAIDAARQRMMETLASRGMIKPDAREPNWTGADWGDLNEDSKEFTGLGQELVQQPKNVALFEQVLGEPFTLMPIIQYRFYPPTYPLALPHQDGYYSPDIGFVGAWIPLVPIDECMGGLAIAVGICKQGYVHDSAKPTPSPIPRNAIPDEAWHRADFEPGDVLLIHPCTPHFGLANRSHRLRLSIDVRLLPQSAAKNIFTGMVTAVDAASITLRNAEGATLTLSVDDNTNIRCHPETKLRVPLAQLSAAAAPGRRIMVLHRDGRATMLRRPSDT